MTAELTRPVGRPPIDYPNEWPPDSGTYGPNARQLAAHELAPHADELLYGGARGGGKTDFALAEALRRCFAVPGLPAVFFRRTYRELSMPGGAIPRLLTRLGGRGIGRWNGGEKVWRFINGSSLTLSYLESAADVQAWMGLEIGFMVFDQVEQLQEDVYVFVRTSLRATGEVGQGLRRAGLRPAAIATANPGGVGHAWVKRRFIDPFPLGEQLFRASPTEAEPTPMVRAFVPARLDDNPALELGDPTYRSRLQMLGADDRKAQLDGDWNVYKGARFGDFRAALHVRDPEQIAAMLPPPATAARACGVDYGNDSPFVALWGCLLPDNLIVVYREVWARGVSPADQAAQILASETPDERTDRAPLPVALDPACWAASPDKPLPRTGGKVVRPTGAPVGSIAWHYQVAGLPIVHADNRRIDGAADIAGRLTVRGDGMPRLIISSQCTQLIETLPQLQRDPKRPEDVLKGSTDHWYDALRYLVMKLGYQGAPAESPPPGGTPIGGRRSDHSDTTVLPSGVVIPGSTDLRRLRRAGF